MHKAHRQLQLSRGPQLRLYTSVRRRLNALQRATEDELIPALKRWGEQDRGTGVVTTLDVRIPSFVQSKLDKLRVLVAELFDTPADDLAKVANQVDKHNRGVIQRVIGIRIREIDPRVAAEIDRWRAVNVSRIRSLADSALVDITQVLEASESVGATVRDLTRTIRERFDVSRSKAALLARDQTLTLNAAITRNRQTTLGIVEYEWSTSQDERVRPAHAELDGTTQRWDTPPVMSDDGRTGHPGEDYQCRCVAVPILPELG